MTPMVHRTRRAAGSPLAALGRRGRDALGHTAPGECLGWPDPRFGPTMPPMTQVRFEHTYECSEDTFWNQIFFDEDYNRRLYLEGLRFHEWREIERQDQGEALRRTVEVVPRIGDLPGPLKKVVGDGIRYKEIGNYDKNRRRYRIEVVPNSLADKLSVTGELFTEPLGEARCRRVFQGDVTAKIFGIGGMLEKRLIEDMQKSYARGAEFTNGYIREKGLSG